jgi:hypothetical protein
MRMLFCKITACIISGSKPLCTKRTAKRYIVIGRGRYKGRQHHGCRCCPFEMGEPLIQANCWSISTVERNRRSSKTGDFFQLSRAPRLIHLLQMLDGICSSEAGPPLSIGNIFSIVAFLPRNDRATKTRGDMSKVISCVPPFVCAIWANHVYFT